MGKVTLQTIADRVGVSKTTVSNAFSRPDQLSEELRAQIQAVAEELGYAGPDPLARGLRSGRAGAVGILMSFSMGHAFSDPYIGEFLRGVADPIGGSNTGLLLLALPPGDGDCASVRNAAVDGFILVSLPEDHPALGVALGRDLPVVAVDSPRMDGVPFVSADDRLAGRELGDRVFGLGHRDVLVLTFQLAADGHVGLVDDERLAAATIKVAPQRIQGLFDAAAAAGVPRDRFTIHEFSSSRSAAAHDVVEAALQSPTPPTAIVCLSDQFALDALDTVDELGKAVPGDLSITGFDDIPAARVAQLTTVRQDTADKGRQALRLLNATDSSDNQAVVVHHEIVERRTLGPAPNNVATPHG